MRELIAVAALALSIAPPAFAQGPQPLPVIVFDAHGFMTSVGDPTTAAALNLAATDLPTKVRGFALAATFYPLRGPGMALGIGAEVLMGRGRHVTVDAAGTAPDIKTATRLTNISGQVSLNFGKKDGWSYLTAGYGPLQLWSYRDDGTLHDAPKSMTLNAGGGARWFSSSHIAFSFDVRFYYTNPENTTATSAGRDRKKLTILSAGISIR